jgi:hypothetical protein
VPSDDRIRRSQQQEKRVAKRYKARQHGGSGTSAFYRNDSHNEAELIECKRTDNTRYIRLDVEELDALARRAYAKGKRPVMHVEIGGREFVVLQEPDYAELRE